MSRCRADRPAQRITIRIGGGQRDIAFSVFRRRQRSGRALVNHRQIINGVYGDINNNAVRQISVRHLNSEAVTAVEIGCWCVCQIATSGCCRTIAGRTDNRPGQSIAVCISRGQRLIALRIFIDFNRGAFFVDHRSDVSSSTDFNSPRQSCRNRTIFTAINDTDRNVVYTRGDRRCPVHQTDITDRHTRRCSH